MEAHIGQIAVSRRTSRKKGASRRIRRQGSIPAVVYGRDREPIPLLLPHEELKAALDPEKKENTLLEMKIFSEKIAAGSAPDEAATTLTVMLKDYQMEPVTRELLHVDFITVDKTKEVQVVVPLEVYGRSEGVKLGGRLTQVFRELPLVCIPAKIPPRVRVDVTKLGIGGSITIGDLELPEGVRATYPNDKTIVLVLAARGAGAETETAEPAAEDAAQ